jgi:phosphatidylserine/phosphatidylglycerophosphate/cardiolipin synthase-like enzyme
MGENEMTMRLLVQPDDSITPVLEAINNARQSIDMYIFRLNYPIIEKALAAAVTRGVSVRTLIAHTSTGGDEKLRKLEQRLLKIGASVSRTDEDLLRYHGKMMIIDKAALYVLGYNFTKKDIDRSRSLGIATTDPALVAEGQRLFACDYDRRLYTPCNEQFIVSPLNSRASLMGLIEGATQQLLIYDARLTDNMMQRALEKQALAGIEVRVIGSAEKRLKEVEVEEYPGGRLHVRAIVVDGNKAFVGSQSLRRTELDRRREIGVVIGDPSIVSQIIRTFESDWALTSTSAG